MGIVGAPMLFRTEDMKRLTDSTIEKIDARLKELE